LAIVFATLKEGDKKAVSAFEEAVEEIPQIVLAQRLFGDPDYLMHVVTRDLPAFCMMTNSRQCPACSTCGRRW
jgi:DNA-binding Lrp family transcriptional regulator